VEQLIAPCLLPILTVLVAIEGKILPFSEKDHYSHFWRVN
jgi:hypothetical protein